MLQDAIPSSPRHQIDACLPVGSAHGMRNELPLSKEVARDRSSWHSCFFAEEVVFQIVSEYSWTKERLLEEDR